MPRFRDPMECNYWATRFKLSESACLRNIALRPIKREGFTPMFPLDLKGKFYATLSVLYITATFYAWYFVPLCFNISSDITSCSTVIRQPYEWRKSFPLWFHRHNGELMRRELAALKSGWAGLSMREEVTIVLRRSIWDQNTSSI